VHTDDLEEDRDDSDLSLSYTRVVSYEEVSLPVGKLEAAARLALSHLLYSGPACVTAGDAIEALSEALRQFDQWDETDGR